IGTIVIALILIAAVVFAVRSIVMQKKKGRCSCGCDCGSCPMSDSCHQKPDENK
ncbi:MAG: FeoB-associated Cys-rich membrane protein, partial [Lachnospiraceae bacterium]|nr:FeoB-associated Cys-rich membrane protein [Lachnospiraceae bacterium]